MIEWLDANGRQHSYTPDVFVRFVESDGKKPWLCEIKLREKMGRASPEVQGRILFREGARLEIQDIHRA